MLAQQHHLILGGTGFIGRHTAILLARAGASITITGRTKPNFDFPEDIAAKITWRALDITAPNWDDLVATADVVHHYLWTSIPGREATDPAQGLAANVGATIGLLEALRRRGHGRLLFLSSGGTVYGKLHRIPADEDDPIAPITAYGMEKAAAELYLRHYRSVTGLDVRIARIANAYGCGQVPARGLGAVTTFIDHALAGRKISIFGDGYVVRDYIHVADIASALATLACIRAPDDFVFNIGGGTGTSLNDIVTILETRLNRSLDVTRSEARPFDVPVSVLAIGRAQAQLNWAPHLNLLAGITRTIQDLQTSNALSTLDPWHPPALQV